MGLTIHYSLQSASRTPAKARQLVEQLRQKALDLPFKEVGEIVEVNGDTADLDKLDRDDQNCWLLIQAEQYLVRGGRHYRITPTLVIAFSTLPGDDPSNNLAQTGRNAAFNLDIRDTLVKSIA